MKPPRREPLGRRAGENISGHGHARELACAHGGELAYQPGSDNLNAFTLSLPCA